MAFTGLACCVCIVFLLSGTDSNGVQGLAVEMDIGGGQKMPLPEIGRISCRIYTFLGGASSSCRRITPCMCESTGRVGLFLVFPILVHKISPPPFLSFILATPCTSMRKKGYRKNCY